VSTHTPQQHACTVDSKLRWPRSSMRWITCGCTLNRRSSWNVLAAMCTTCHSSSASVVKDTYMCTNGAADHCRCLGSNPLTYITHTCCTRVRKAQSAKPAHDHKPHFQRKSIFVYGHPGVPPLARARPTNATAIFCSRKLSCFKAPDGAATTTGVFLYFIQTKLARDAVRLRLPTLHPEYTTPRSKVTEIG